MSRASKSVDPSIAEQSAPSQVVSQAIYEAFQDYHRQFQAISRRAKCRFEQCDWKGSQLDAVERLDLYSHVLNPLVRQLHTLLGEGVRDRSMWAKTKRIYSRMIANRNDIEIAETFFNSVTRRIFATVGVDPMIEFIWMDAELLPSGDETPVYTRYAKDKSTRELVRQILGDYRFDIPYEDMERDAALVAAAVDDRLTSTWHSVDFHVIEVIRPVFYRNKGAYIVGRIRRSNRVIPFVLPLINTPKGVAVDTVLLTENEVSIVFSFTRSYFHVEAEHPGEIVGFLKSILPLKPVAELYTSIGYHKHGKTVLYRDLRRHLQQSTDKFVSAPGEKGMVMTVFTLPSYDIVFKVIKDRFAYPKTATRQEVMDRYRLVSKHDRVGRLVDAQEFEHLSFDRHRFSQALIDELLATASRTVVVTENEVVLKHVYTERRLYPLNLYIREMAPHLARRAVIDYGNAIKDLAAANIFPGDLLVKNFGVTRHGRVVFYDYDELCLLSDCNFRKMPESDYYEDEISATPWFSVGDNDIFPEEFRTFLWLPKHLREVMEAYHGDLFEPEYWQMTQERVKAGDILDVFPYPQEKRFIHQYQQESRQGTHL
jgi:isocitrate dehydrogenase kinase/phosphatase